MLQREVMHRISAIHFTLWGSLEKLVLRVTYVLLLCGTVREP
jgi:hypothetical protein